MAEHFAFLVPDWLSEINGSELRISDMEERTRFVVDASRRTVMEGTGVPFAAAIFDLSDGRLIALGVNLALKQKSSVLHGEMVAIMLAQRKLGVGKFGHGYELITSSEPCSMCFGAIPWADVKRVVCAARASDDLGVHFDEGDKRADWSETYRLRGIEVIQDVCRAQAVQILQDYTRPGSSLYEARQRAGLGM